MGNFLDKRFQCSANGSSVRQELLAGFTTFLAMAYILAVNPNILGAAGMHRGGVFIATALAAIVGSVLMGLLANYPFALAPAMGLNAYFAFTVVKTFGYSWQFALFAVFIEGLIFLLMSVTSFREVIFDSIPMPLKQAAGIGIGFFIAFIAFRNAGLVVDSPSVLVTVRQFSGEAFRTSGICAVLALVGVLLTSWMIQLKIRAAIILGIIITWILGIVMQLVGIYVPNPDAGAFSLIPNLSLTTFADSFQGFKGLFGSAFNCNAWSNAAGNTGAMLLLSIDFLMIVMAFLFVDLFSALGTLAGIASQAGMLDENGRLPRIRGAFMADSIATSAGAIFGTSTTSSYVESAAGVVAGGRTGLTALTVAGFFLVSLLLAPLFLAVPSFATAPALVIVGFYMIQPITSLKLNEFRELAPVLLTIMTMPFTNSITDGIAVGIISWTVLHLACRRKVSVLMIVLSVLFVLKYAML